MGGDGRARDGHAPTAAARSEALFDTILVYVMWWIMARSATAVAVRRDSEAWPVGTVLGLTACVTRAALDGPILCALSALRPNLACSHATSHVLVRHYEAFTPLTASCVGLLSCRSDPWAPLCAAFAHRGLLRPQPAAASADIRQQQQLLLACGTAAMLQQQQRGPGGRQSAETRQRQGQFRPAGGSSAAAGGGAATASAARDPEGTPAHPGELVAPRGRQPCPLAAQYFAT